MLLKYISQLRSYYRFDATLYSQLIHTSILCGRVAAHTFWSSNTYIHTYVVNLTYASIGNVATLPFKGYVTSFSYLSQFTSVLDAVIDIATYINLCAYILYPSDHYNFLLRNNYSPMLIYSKYVITYMYIQLQYSSTQTWHSYMCLWLRLD